MTQVESFNKTLIKEFSTDEGDFQITVDVKLDEYFSVTGAIMERDYNGSYCREHSCGQIVDDIEEHFPELAPFLKWHLVDADGTPMHYEANTHHHVKSGNVELAMKTSMLPESYFYDADIISKKGEVMAALKVEEDKALDLQNHLLAALDVGASPLCKALEDRIYQEATTEGKRPFINTLNLALRRSSEERYIIFTCLAEATKPTPKAARLGAELKRVCEQEEIFLKRLNNALPGIQAEFIKDMGELRKVLDEAS